ncbi:MAG TPA: XF1762 family protein, partial [Gemmatimonadaceae bacterium]|nr:XF1762 family protein [Gemmatimonadaceae bacterium]
MTAATEDRTRLRCRWIPMHIARFYLAKHHRHLPRITGAIIALGCYDADRLCGVAFMGRPLARLGDGGMERSEVLRVATDGTPNAGSALYGACRRVAAALGLLPPTTKTLLTESGA